jgi:multicomponent Na+:H+ antiporter subunit B
MKLVRASALLVVLIMTMFMFISTGALPQIYNPQSPAATHVSDRYIEKAVEETGSPNLVTAVLADYRGYDTLGETTVIFTAGLATVLLLRASKNSAPKGERDSTSEGGQE